MDEQNQTETEEKKAQGTTENTDIGNKYETTPVIERAREEREKMEKATAALKIENDRAEAIMAKRALGGQTDAGQYKEKEFTEEEKKSRARIKAIGNITNSPWAKNYE